MTRLRRNVSVTSPGIQRQAKRYERHLRAALQLAARRDSRKDPDLAKIYASATVEGIDIQLCTKTATISFQRTPLRGSFHLMYEWSSLLQFSPREIADGISFSVRDNLLQTRRERRKR